MMDDEDIERGLRALAARWKSASFRQRWLFASSSLIVICAVPFGLSFIKMSPQKDTVAAIVDGNWCQSPAAVHTTREIVNIPPSINLCVIPEKTAEAFGRSTSEPRRIGQAVTHYFLPLDFPPEHRIIWGLLMLAMSMLMGFTIAKDIDKST